MIPEQVSVYFPVGHSTQDPSRQNVHASYDIENPDGWKRHIEQRIRPIIDMGVRQVELHNPGGHDIAQGTMRFDQWEKAKEKGLDFKNDFQKAFGALVKEGIDVIGYIGNPDDLDELKDLDGSYDADPLLDANDAWIKRNPHSLRDMRWKILNMFRHMRKAGVRLGLDACTTKGPDSFSWWIANGELDRGRMPVVELTAQKDARHWWHFDQLIRYRSFRPRHMDRGTQWEHPGFIAGWPQIGEGDWYTGTTIILLGDTEQFLSGELNGQVVRLWQDPTPLIAWWNEIKDRDPVSKYQLMMGQETFKKLVAMDLLKELAT